MKEADFVSLNHFFFFLPTIFIHILKGKKVQTNKQKCFPIFAYLGQNYHGKYLDG